MGHKKYERNLPQYQAGQISEEEWAWHGFEQRIAQEKQEFDRSDIIIATSPDEETRLLAEPYLSDINKITVIPPGYNDKIFKPLKPQERNKLKYKFEYTNLDGNKQQIDLSDKKVVSSLGRVVRDKGFSELSRSMAEIMFENPNVVYMVSGEKGNPITEECQEILRGFEDHVVFLPSLNQTEMAQVYNVSDIFVMSSLNEAFGMVPIEAMGCKSAVIVGRSGFNDFAHCADIRNDSQDYTKAIGIYAPSQESDRWRQVKALKILLNKDELRNQIAQNGYDYVRANLTWEQISATKDKLVQDVLAANPQRMSGLKVKKNQNGR